MECASPTSPSILHLHLLADLGAPSVLSAEDSSSRSSSGSIDEEAIHYLRTRGIELPKAKKLLINGFLNEIFENISDQKIKKFLEKSIEEQINGI